MDSANLQNLAKMLELHRMTMLADVARQERLVTSVASDLVRLSASLATRDSVLVDGCLGNLTKAAQLCETERESLDEIDKVVRAIRSEA
jgi:hypothetical protein